MLVRILTLFLSLWGFTAQALIGAPLSSLEDAPYAFRIKHCGASKIAKDFFVTAAHCLPIHYRQGLSSNLSLMMDKAISLEPGEQERLDLQAVYVDQRFFRESQSLGVLADQAGVDVALVRVHPTPAFARLPILSLYRVFPERGLPVELLGWGNSFDAQGSSPGPQYQNLLRSGASRISESQEYYFKVDETLGPRSAIGDSGSPVIAKDKGGQAYLVGVTAHQDAGGGNQRYSRITPNIYDWIQQVLSNQAPALQVVSQPLSHQRLKNSYALLATLTFRGAFRDQGQEVRCWKEANRHFCASVRTEQVSADVYQALDRIFYFDDQRRDSAYLYCKQLEGELTCITSPTPLSPENLSKLMAAPTSVF